MATQMRLDKKARTAVTAAIVAVLAGPVLLIGSRIAAVTVDKPIVASSNHDDRLVFIRGHTMLLEHGTMARRVADWLKVRSTDTRTFEVSDQAFAPNSTELTPAGSSQLIHFAQLMKSHTTLSAQILVSAHSPSAASRTLEQNRARRLRDEVVGMGVASSRISAPGETKTAEENKGLVVVLTR